VLSNGNPYGIQDGIVYSFPCRSKGDGSYEIVPGLEVNDWLRERMNKSEEELTSEKGCVGHLVGEAHVDVPDAGCPVDLEDTLLPGEM
jgi:malate dehydrogenase (NADP+)